MESGHHIISVSLGGPAKPTGLAVIEPHSKYQHPKGDESQLVWDNYYNVRHLERLAAGRAYPAIVARVREVASHKRLARGSTLLVDITNTGAPPLRLFEDQGLYPEPFQVTDGGNPAYGDNIQALPRRDMISAAQVVLQQPDRLNVSSALELAPTLVTDLQAYDPDMPERSQNADLVTAVAVAVWWGERLTWDDEVADRMLPDDDPPDDSTRSTIGGY